MVVRRHSLRWLKAGITKAIPALRVATAAVILALILMPAEVWQRPSVDLTVEGFDSSIQYVDERGGRYVFAPFQVLTNGAWKACPCEPSSYLVLVGSNLSQKSFTDPEGVESLGGVSVRVDGRPTRVFAVSPGQINFFLRADVAAPASTITVLRDGEEIGRQVIAISDLGLASPVAVSNVETQPNQLQMFAAPASQPAVHLLTTPLAFRASFDVVIDRGSSAEPFRAMLWNPRDFSAVSLVFGPAPDRIVSAVVSGERGEIISEQIMGAYESGAAQTVQVEVEPSEFVRLSVGPSGEPEGTRSVKLGTEDAPSVLEAYRPTLTVVSSGGTETSIVTLSNYKMELPHDRFLTVRTNDDKILPITLALLAFAVLLHINILIRTFRNWWNMARRLTVNRWLTACVRFVRQRRVALALAAGLPIAVGVGYVMTLGSHPFDMASQKIWTYLLVTNGVEGFYYQAQTVPVAKIWGGIPFHEGVYPYGVSMSYYFLSIGWVHQLFGGDVSPDSQSLELSIKIANMIVAIAVGALVLGIARGFGNARFALLAAIAFLFNPAVLFDVVVWGETEPVALFFLLASILASQRSSARWAWILLGLTMLGKPTIVLPAVITGIYYLRLFPLRMTIQGISAAVPVVSAATLPYIMTGYPPSIAIDPLLGVLRVFGGSEMEDVFKVVSFDAYSVWPLVTLFGHGQNGLARLNFPDTTTLVGPFSYHLIGLIAFAAVLTLALGWLVTSSRVRKDPALIFLVLAFITLAELVLPTRAIARYLVFPLVFAILGAGSGSAKTMWFVVGALTFTSLIGMYGSVASGIESAPSLAPRLAPDGNIISATALQLFRSDVIITIGSLLNIAALMALASAIWLPRRSELAAASRPPLTEGSATRRIPLVSS